MAVLTGRATLSAKSMHTMAKQVKQKWITSIAVVATTKSISTQFPMCWRDPSKFQFLNKKPQKKKHHHLVIKSSLKNIDAKLLHKESQNPTNFLTDPSKQKETGKWVLGLVVPASHHHSLPTTLPYPTHSRRKKDCKSIYLFTCLFFAEMGRRRNSQRGGKESVDNMISESRKVSLKNPPSG